MSDLTTKNPQHVALMVGNGSQSVSGDIDTHCAIVSGIVACYTEVPLTWIEQREPLPYWAIVA